MIYTASFTPFKIAFLDEIPFYIYWLDLFVDFLFVLDLFINFFSAFEKDDGKVEKRHKVIIADYLFTWFLLDIFACIPFNLFEIINGSSTTNG